MSSKRSLIKFSYRVKGGEWEGGLECSSRFHHELWEVPILIKEEMEYEGLPTENVEELQWEYYEQRGLGDAKTAQAMPIDVTKPPEIIDISQGGQVANAE